MNAIHQTAESSGALRLMERLDSTGVFDNW